VVGVRCALAARSARREQWRPQGQAASLCILDARSEAHGSSVTVRTMSGKCAKGRGTGNGLTARRAQIHDEDMSFGRWGRCPF
jgi:hypothetical protein